MNRISNIYFTYVINPIILMNRTGNNKHEIKCDK